MVSMPCTVFAVSTNIVPDLQVLTMRAARGLLANKLTTPQAISEAPLEEEVKALHSEGNVQRGMRDSSMLHGLQLVSNYKQILLLETFA